MYFIESVSYSLRIKNYSRDSGIKGKPKFLRMSLNGYPNASTQRQVLFTVVEQILNQNIKIVLSFRCHELIWWLHIVLECSETALVQIFENACEI